MVSLGPQPSLPAFNSKVDLHPLVVLLQDPVILAQRKSFPAVRRQNAFQVRMTVEFEADIIVHFTLQPVASRPQGHGTWQRFAVGYLCLYPDAFIAHE